MYRLIYKSRSATPVDWAQVTDILHTSEASNREAGITGALLATDSHFLQVIEGPYESVNRTFMRIVRDPRHTDIWLIGFSVIDARLFEDWGMKGIGIFDLNRETEAMLMRKYGEEDGSVHFPLDEWKALALIQDVDLTGDPPGWKA